MHLATGSDVYSRCLTMASLCHFPALPCVLVHLIQFNLLVHTSPLTSSTNEKNKVISVWQHITGHQSSWTGVFQPPTSPLLQLLLITNSLLQSKMLSFLWSPCLGHQNTGSPSLKCSASPPKNFTVGRPVTNLSYFKDWQLTQESFLLDEILSASEWGLRGRSFPCSVLIEQWQDWF